MDILYTTEHAIGFFGLRIDTEETFFSFMYDVIMKENPGKTSPALVRMRRDADEGWLLLLLAKDDWSYDVAMYPPPRVTEAELPLLGINTEDDLSTVYASLQTERVFQYDIHFDKPSSDNSLLSPLAVFDEIFRLLPGMAIVGVMDELNNTSVRPMDTVYTIVKEEEEESRKERRKRAKQEKKDEAVAKQMDRVAKQRHTVSNMLREKKDRVVSDDERERSDVMVGIFCTYPYAEIVKRFTEIEVENMPSFVIQWSRFHQELDGTDEKMTTPDNDIVLAEKVMEKLTQTGDLEHHVREYMDTLETRFEEDPAFADEFADGIAKVSTVVADVSNNYQRPQIDEMLNSMRSVSLDDEAGGEEEEETEEERAKERAQVVMVKNGEVSIFQ